MTDHLHPFSDDDLSAAADGLADHELQARIDADPAAAARVDELRAISERLGASTTEPLDDDTVDDLIATALDTPIAPAQVASGSRRGPAPWLVAAAVVILMAIGLTLIWAGQGSKDDSASSQSTFDTVGSSIATEDGADSPDSSFSSRAGQETNKAADNASTRTGSSEAAPTAGVGLIYLGDYQDGDALRTAIAGSLSGATDGGWNATYDGRGLDQPSTAAIDRCAEQLQVTLSMKAPPIQEGFATVADKPVLVYEFATPSSKDTSKETTLVAAVGPDACEQVVIFER